MTKSSLISSTFLSGILVFGMFGSFAIAADVDASQLPAVSAINGKVEFAGGFADINSSSSDEQFFGGASLSLPMGDMFGLQADIAVKEMFGNTAAGGTLHLFTRDPNSYLFGAIAGYAASEGASSVWAGGEAELYMDNISFELAAGYMGVNPDVGSNSDELFAFADAAFYPVENFRLSIGASSVAGFTSGHAKAEYMLDAMPVSLSLQGQLGEDNFAAISAGVSFYFGGNDQSKSLMRRHREDDPRNRVLDIFGAGSAAFGGGAGVGGAGGAGGGEEMPTCEAGYTYFDGEGCLFTGFFIEELEG